MATKEEVIDYVMTTPSNPNKAVLSGMLDGMSQGGTAPLEINLSRTASYGSDDWETTPFVCDTELSVVSEAVKSGRTVIAHAIEHNTETPPLLTNAWTSCVSFVLGNFLIPLTIFDWMGKDAQLSPNPTSTNEWNISITPNS